jgi:hypothetical protein
VEFGDEFRYLNKACLYIDHGVLSALLEDLAGTETENNT